jgi:hypothetical protein
MSPSKAQTTVCLFLAVIFLPYTTTAKRAGTLGSSNLPIDNPVPYLTGVFPTTATTGGSEFTLTVSGNLFASNAVVLWNGQSRSTTFVSSTQLTAQITSADIASVGT